MLSLEEEGLRIKCGNNGSGSSCFDTILRNDLIKRFAENFRAVSHLLESLLSRLQSKRRGSGGREVED